MVVEGAELAVLRRRVGPVAWCALEVLLERACPDGDGLVVETSVRLVAVELAVAKNTAQRALKALRSSGIIEPVQGRGAGGRFAATRYRLNLPTGILGVFHLDTKSSPQRPRRPRPRAARAGEQLVLVPPA